MNSMKGLIVSSALTTVIFIFAVMSFFSDGSNPGEIDPTTTASIAKEQPVKSAVRQIEMVAPKAVVKAPVPKKKKFDLADLIENDSSEVPALSADINPADLQPAKAAKKVAKTILKEATIGETNLEQAVSNVITGSVKAASESTSGTGGTVSVKPGDTLYAISRRSGVSVPALIKANNLTDPSKIRSGQVLRLP